MASTLFDFWLSLKSALRGPTDPDRVNAGGGGTRRRSEHFADVRNFSNLVNIFLGIMPDPDEVIKKAGLNASVYRDILTDAHAAGSMMQRKSRVKRMKLVILAGDAKDAKSVKARDMVEAQIDDISRMPNVLNEILEAPFFGATYLEMFWSRTPIMRGTPNGEIVLTDLMSKPYEWFAWDLDGNLKIKENMLTPLRTKFVPENKIYPVVKDGTYINPYGDRAAKRAYWPYLFKKGGFRFWTEFLEKFGQPFLFGKPDPSKNQDEVDEFFEALVDMVRNGVAVSQTGSQKDIIEVVESKGKAGSTDAHKAYKNAMNIEISKAILGETLTIENSETGSQAATETHLEVLESIQDEDKQMAENAYFRIFKTITRLNFGPEVKSPIARLVDTQKISSDIAERDSTLTKNLGVRFKKEYVAETYNINEDHFEMSKEPVKPPEETPAEPQGAQGGGTVEDEPDGTRAPDDSPDDGGAKFAEEEAFNMQRALDSYIEDSLNRYDRLTAPVRQAITDIIKTSKDFGEFTVRMAELKDQIDNGLFSRVFQEALGVAEVAGVWAVPRDVT